MAIKVTPREIRQTKMLTKRQMSLILEISPKEYALLEKNSEVFRQSKISLAKKMAEIGNITLDDIYFFY